MAFRSIRVLVSPCNYFDAGFAGVGDLACFYIVAFVEKALIKHFYFSKFGDAVGSLLRRFGLSWVLSGKPLWVIRRLVIQLGTAIFGMVT